MGCAEPLLRTNLFYPLPLRGRHAQWSCPTSRKPFAPVGRDDSARRKFDLCAERTPQSFTVHCSLFTEQDVRVLLRAADSRPYDGSRKFLPRADRDVCERRRWRIQRAKRSGSGRNLKPLLARRTNFGHRNRSRPPLRQKRQIVLLKICPSRSNFQTDCPGGQSLRALLEVQS